MSFWKRFYRLHEKEIEDVKGFKNLECDFSKDGMVSGSYVATFLFRFNIRMESFSKLAFDEEGSVSRYHAVVRGGQTA